MTIILLIGLHIQLIGQGQVSFRDWVLSPSEEISWQKKKEKKKRRKYKNQKWKKRRDWVFKKRQKVSTQSKDHRYSNQRTLRRMFTNL